MQCKLPRTIVISEIIRTITATITGSGNSTYCYATINGTKRSDAGGPYEVETGDTITFAVRGWSAKQGRVIIDGTTVLSVTTTTAQTYAWTVPSGIATITIAMTYDDKQSNCRITVTTA